MENDGIRMLSDTDAHTKPQSQSPCTFMQMSLYIILLAPLQIKLYYK